ncbi:MAG: substrate-binding domain-containing protein [Thermodesulfobacteriota bacterium]
MKEMFSTKQVAKFLDINEKMVYSLISEKGLPATKITGKWLFPRHLVEQWVENNTLNYPEPAIQLPPYHGLLILAGSNDPLLDKALTVFNRLYSEHLAVFGNLGSMGGIRALRRSLCHIASSHLLQENEKEYNFEFATRELEKSPAVVNFCRREQGILVQKGNPKSIGGIADLARKGLKIVNRPVGTGTRLLFDRELKKAGIAPEQLAGYDREVSKHLDAGLEILSGNVDAAPSIRPIAQLLNLDFIPLRWERFDLLVTKERFFDEGVQLFFGMLHESAFLDAAATMAGYDLSTSGKMIFPT